MRLALFDLDHTLLPVDSADGWARFLVEHAGLDPAVNGPKIRQFAADYHAGRFDVDAYLAWHIGLLAQLPRAALEHWRARYFHERIAAHVRPEARALVERHRAQGDTLALVTGTNAFVTAPIAAAFGIDHLLAVRPEERDGEFTGGYVGTHTYQDGKVRAVLAWLAGQGLTAQDVERWTFYSDSINDLPLMEFVAARGGLPVVTHGDVRLRGIAVERGWPQLQLFETAHGQPQGDAAVGAVALPTAPSAPLAPPATSGPLATPTPTAPQARGVGPGPR
jgi:HAD superfamily hydrolase (TIGR01490 family)